MTTAEQKREFYRAMHEAYDEKRASEGTASPIWAGADRAAVASRLVPGYVPPTPPWFSRLRMRLARVIWPSSEPFE